jgi:hypothetical protein
MQNLSKEYALLFNTLTDTEVALEQLRASLIAAQQRAEELYISAPDFPDCDKAG